MNKGIWAILPAITLVIAMGATFSTQTTTDVEAQLPSTAMFMNIAGIPGESTDDNHKEWIELTSISHGIINPTAGTVKSGDSGSRKESPVNHNDFSVSKSLDSSSTSLYTECCQGEHIPRIDVELCRTTGDKICYMKYKFTDVIITGVSTGGSSGDTVPTEHVTFNYGEIEWTYTQLDREGNPTGKFTEKWDMNFEFGGKR